MPPENWQAAPPSYPNTPPAPSPPQPPLQPYTDPAPWQPAAQPELASQYIKPRRHWIKPTLIGLGVLIAAGAGVWLAQMYRNNPMTIFNQALGNSLKTKQLQASVSSTALNTSLILDVSNPKNPRVSSLTTKSLGVAVYVKGYGSQQNTYISYASDPSASTTTPTNLLDQWIQVRASGELPAGLALSPLFAAGDPRYQVLGPWIFGNFSGQDRSVLQKLVKSEKLYRFNSHDVTPLTLNGQAVLRYDLAVNGDALAMYEERAAALFGVPKSDSQAATQGLNGTTVNLKIYVQKRTRRVVRVDITMHGLTTTSTYSSFNTAELPAEPKADLTYRQYLERLGS